jgi:hypothetical protein
MGLLVAGITGGASLIDTSRVTSLKREVDDYIRDVFTFYAKVGRFPGDLDNTGKIGWNGNSYEAGRFSSPYNSVPINALSGPFVELYLYDISSFKPDPTDSGISASDVNYIADHGGIPFSKIYKDFILVYRTDDTSSSDSNNFFYKLSLNTRSIDVLLTTVSVANKKTVDIVKKIDLKFDDGSHSGGNIRGWCNKEHTTQYANANFCSQLLFFFDIK